MGLFLSLVCLVEPVRAVDPRLGAVHPPGAQAGTTLQMRFEGDRLQDTQELLFYQSGFKVDSIDEITDKSVKVTLQIAPDCAWGEHHVRLRTASGVSDLRTLFVGPFPVVERNAERKPSDPPQSIPLNTTVYGSLPKETVDRYRIEAKQGQRLSAEVESMRLGRGFNDPAVSILDSRERILARSDDTALFIQDCFASALIPADGEYFVEVRETSYDGLDFYRMHIGTFARPAAVYPAGGPAGQPLEVRFVDPVGGDFTQTIALPQPSRHPFGIFPEVDGVRAPSWNLLRVVAFPNVLEAEPNDQPGQATPFTNAPPVAFNGIMDRENDEDWFQFTARKGESFDVRVFGRSIRSPIDSVLVLANAQGGGIASNDDSGGPDSYVRFNAPDDGTYTVRVTDHLGKGGPSYSYRVELNRVEPDLTLYVPDAAQYDTQTRKAIVVPRNNRFLLLVNARRQDFGGALTLKPDDFPPGISLQTSELDANKQTWAAVFEAAPDAPIGGKLARISAHLADPNANPQVLGAFWQNVDLVQQGNQGVYYATWVDQIAVAVVEELPFKIRLEEPKAPLVRSGSLPLKIIAERKEGFDEPIRIQFPVRPPGLNCEPEITLEKGKSEVIYPLSASGDAEIKEHQIALLGYAGVAGGTAYVGTQLAKLQITDSFVVGKIPLATTIQGQPVRVKCELEQKFPFDGKAKVELVGLPPGATSEPKEITKDDKEIVFDVATAPDARTGLHRTLFCQLNVDYQSEPVSQSFGGRGSLRIDPPPPPPEPEEKQETQAGQQAAKESEP